VRLLLVVDAFPPLRTSAAVQMRDLAAAFMRHGHSCAVVTPDSKVTGSFSFANEGEIPVLRIQSGPLKRINLVRRALNEIALSGRMWSGYRRSPVATQAWDAIVFYSPTIFFGRFIARLKSLHHCPAYLILRDVFPDWAVDMGLMRKGPHYWLFRAYARYQYRVADFIGIESPSNRRYFETGNPRIDVLPNWIDDQSPPPDASLPESLHSRKILVYAGNIGVAQDMDNLLRLARNLLVRSDCKILFVGDGTDRTRIQAEAMRQGLTNIVFLPEIDPQQLRGLLRRCNVGLISLDRRLKSHNIPGKLLSYLEAGLPVLASINYGSDLKAVIENGHVGFVVANGDDRALTRAAHSLLDNPEMRARMSAASKELCKTMFSPDSVVQKLCAQLSQKRHTAVAKPT
jgi:glycosyltransferase involved in cell wall biosynthesis